MTANRPPSVSFVVWDARLDLPPVAEGPSWIETTDGGVVAVGLSRGGGSNLAPGVVVWSFQPAALVRSPRWHVLHALTAVVSDAGQSTDLAVSVSDVVPLSRSAGTACQLTFGDTTVDASRFDVTADRWVIAPNDPALPLAVAGYAVAIPRVDEADLMSWGLTQDR